MGSTTRLPKKAVITFGKPDAHRNIHIGHLSGGMINVDIFARFMINRIGKSIAQKGFGFFLVCNKKQFCIMFVLEKIIKNDNVGLALYILMNLQ